MMRLLSTLIVALYATVAMSSEPAASQQHGASTMSEHAPRVPAIPPEQFTAEQAEIAGDRHQWNFTRVMVQHPTVYRTYIPYAEQLMARSSLPPRDREILILRTLRLCNETYDATHHELIGRNVGLTEAEIRAAQTGAGELSAFERTLVRAAEELVRTHRMTDATWQQLGERYSRQQQMEVVFLVGNYTSMAMVTNSFGIQPEAAAH
jgi:4-carboxymuconolactone decarboxylase